MSSVFDRLKNLKIWSSVIEESKVGIPKGYKKKYGIHDKCKSYQINHFESIGWQDPTIQSCQQPSSLELDESKLVYS